MYLLIAMVLLHNYFYIPLFVYSSKSSCKQTTSEAFPNKIPTVMNMSHWITLIMTSDWNWAWQQWTHNGKSALYSKVLLPDRNLTGSDTVSGFSLGLGWFFGYVFGLGLVGFRFGYLKTFLFSPSDCANCLLLLPSGKEETERGQWIVFTCWTQQ